MSLEVDQLTHSYGTELAVDSVSFGLEEGELVALIGPSGCGKTTIVQAIAGHVQPTAGRISLRGRDVTGEPPEERHVGIVFQQPTLYPHMCVSENVAYGLTARGLDRQQRTQRVNQYLELVDLCDQRDTYPSELSGGQQRRVEVARALAPQPDVLLLDEPLSALDRQLRERLREEIARIQDETGVTTLFVTHDQEEAMALADRLLVMNDGHISGSGTPRTLYRSPRTQFVASFLGRSNTFSATVVARKPLILRVGEREFTRSDEVVTVPEGTSVTCHVRPADVSIRPPARTVADETVLSLPGEVVSVADIGCRYDVTVQTTTGHEFVVETAERSPREGDKRTIELPRDRITVFESGGGGRGGSTALPETSF
ncbi:ABC transporter ATP-binding protein [Halobacteria archaeon AArc-curdl1]|uniref:Molybdate/tungstate import ATP-binding protein WtpC n=1 Tax=Natronosalvus hydrolyticus TaxID=2979988 RepID=A0AAP2ZBP6_9EURY|nr:ABC transporter ATP-binding protein [Halobacteria archaeon AArc-curdl1]